MGPDPAHRGLGILLSSVRIPQVPRRNIRNPDTA